MGSDGVCLLQIFPEEIWTQICTNFKDFSAYNKASVASAFLRKMVVKQRTTILFADVAVVLHKYLAKKLTSKKASQLLITCRATCRSCKRGVDKVLQNLDLFYNFASIRDILAGYMIVSNKNLFPFLSFNLSRSENAVAKFKRYFESSSANPFVYRSIYVHYISLCPDTAPAYADFLALLQNFGHHIWYCHISIVDVLREFCCYAQIKEMLRLLPNLKVLSIHNLQATEYNPENLARLRQNGQRTTVRTLPHLQLIKTYGIPAALCEQLWQNNPHITMLECLDAGSNFAPNVSNVLHCDLPNLKKLCLFIYTNELFQEFDRCPQVWRLTKLDVIMDCVSVDWDEIFFAMFRKFGESLKELRLALPRTNRENYGGQLLLPGLKVISLEMRNFVCLDFLLPMRENLEELTLAVHSSLPEDLPERGIELYTHRQELHRSNIWTLFPVLKRVTWKDGYEDMKQSCTRAQWEYQTRRQRN